jgi:hypothetical protein
MSMRPIVGWRASRSMDTELVLDLRVAFLGGCRVCSCGVGQLVESSTAAPVRSCFAASSDLRGYPVGRERAWASAQDHVDRMRRVGGGAVEADITAIREAMNRARTAPPLRSTSSPTGAPSRSRPPENRAFAPGGYLLNRPSRPPPGHCRPQRRWAVDWRNFSDPQQAVDRSRLEFKPSRRQHLPTHRHQAPHRAGRRGRGPRASRSPDDPEPQGRDRVPGRQRGRGWLQPLKRLCWQTLHHSCPAGSRSIRVHDLKHTYGH